MSNIERYNKIVIASKNCTDVLGMPIDKGVIDLVVLFNYYGFATLQSCWGHKDWGLQYPWIDFESKENQLNEEKRPQPHINNLNYFIETFDIEFDSEYIDGIRLRPKNKTLKGRKEFSKIKKFLVKNIIK